MSFFISEMESWFMMYLVEEEIYSILFFFFFVTSLLYSLCPTVYFFLLLDKLAIMYVVLYGALCLWEKTFHEIEILMIVFTFVCPSFNCTCLQNLLQSL